MIIEKEDTAASICWRCGARLCTMSNVEPVGNADTLRPCRGN